VNNLIVSSYSQAKQDLHASIVCNKRDGFFLDLGCNDPKFHNNSYALEIDLNWHGILIDIQSNMVNSCMNTRSTLNKYVVADLTTTNIADILVETKCPYKIDYISFDVDDATETVLNNFPFDNYSFNFMTFEHDSYRLGPHLKELSTSILSSYDYVLYKEDVPADRGEIFEDWWICPKLLENL